MVKGPKIALCAYNGILFAFEKKRAFQHILQVDEP
jgi:hypothetical protein